MITLSTHPSPDSLESCDREVEVTQFGGSWSESKLACVGEYAVAYLQVMQQQTWATLHYIDAFAGRGRQTLRGGAADALLDAELENEEAEAFLVGSAVRVLRASCQSTRGFDHFTFIDAHRPSCDELHAVVSEECPELLPVCDFECDDANAALGTCLTTIDWRTGRALVFLDPFGLEVRWETVEALAATGACDVWYLFPLGGVIRMMTNSGQIPDSWRRRLDGLFGTTDWYDEFYPASQGSLFGEKDVPLKDASTKHVVGYIRRRLATVFPAVSDAAVLTNSRGFPLFALVLGVANPRPAAQQAALRIGNHLVKRLSTP
jgi:three-Cys-motif partner protein